MQKLLLIISSILLFTFCNTNATEKKSKKTVRPTEINVDTIQKVQINNLIKPVESEKVHKKSVNLGVIKRNKIHFVEIKLPLIVRINQPDGGLTEYRYSLKSKRINTFNEHPEMGSEEIDFDIIGVYILDTSNELDDSTKRLLDDKIKKIVKPYENTFMKIYKVKKGERILVTDL